MTTAHALQTPSTPRNFCSMDAAPILATMPKPAPAKPQAPQQARVLQDLFGADKSLSAKLTHQPTPTDCGSTKVSHPGRMSASAKWLLGSMAHTSQLLLGTIRRPASAWSCSALQLGTGQPTIERRGGNGSVSVEGDKLTQADRKRRLRGNWPGFSADLVASKVEFGRHNSDGSNGFNAAASADLVSIEGTADFSAFGGILEGSLTAGGGIGVGGEVGVGFRDQDNDGKPELCARVGGKFGPGGTLGACLELPKLANLPRLRR